MMDMQMFRNLAAELLNEGWQVGIFPEDAEIASAYDCDECGKAEVRGAGYMKDGNPQKGYRAFAVCSNCGTVHEF